MTAELSFKTTMAFRYGEPCELAPGVVRVVANNPGPFTFKGTNTYLVGRKTLAVIDPGPDDPAHRAAILAAAGGRRITHIFITHAHRDHVDGAAALEAATGALSVGHGRAPGRRVGSEPGPSGRAFVDFDFAPALRVGEGDTVAGEDWAITAVHTPGHAPDHICLALAGTGLLFSGDHVMAWNTSVVAPPEGRMADYLASLELLLRRPESVYLPGHGGRIEEPQRTVKAYLLHRRWREQAILDAIRQGSRTIRSIVPIVYRGIDARLVGAASLSVQAHVEHLVERGLVACEGPPTFDCDLSIV